MSHVHDRKKAAVSAVRKVLQYTVHLPVHWKAPIITVIITLLSVIARLNLSPQLPFLSDKNNPVNTVLVKWSWGWTLLCVTPSALLTTSGLQWQEVVHHLFRLLVAHCVWLFTTQGFISLDGAVGACSDASGRGRSECLQGNGSWNGFDISGHAFLLTFCVYVLTEEVSGLRLEAWRELNAHHHQEPGSRSRAVWDKELLSRVHMVSSPLASVLELFAAALMTVWVTMAMVTSLYFHSLLEKVLGAVCGWLAWLLTYSWETVHASQARGCCPTAS